MKKRKPAPQLATKEGRAQARLGVAILREDLTDSIATLEKLLDEWIGPDDELAAATLAKMKALQEGLEEIDEVIDEASGDAE